MSDFEALPGLQADAAPDGSRQLPLVAVVVGEAKRCPRCAQTLPREGFFRNAARKDGLSSLCRVCHSDANPKRRRQLDHPQLLPVTPLFLERLRNGVGRYSADPTVGVRNFGVKMAAAFGGDPEVYRLQVDRILRGDVTSITMDSADRLALAVGSSAPGFWGTKW